MRTVKLGNFTLDDANPPVFMAEIGTYFNNDTSLAIELVKKIKDAGADIVKGEILHSPEICLDDDSEATYITHEKGSIKENYRAMIERKVVPLEHYREIFSACDKLGMPFVVSVYDFKGADFAIEIGACALKIATSNIVHAPLIRYAANLAKANGKPLFIDTGKSTLEEITRAVEWARSEGCKDLVVEHSPAAAPNPLSEHNLRMLFMLKEVFDVPTGLSCHHSGEEMMHAAVAMGANIIEKGVCADPRKPDQDFYWAMPIDDLKGAVTRCRNIYLALGKRMRRIPSPRQVPNDRMGLVAGKDISKGMKADFNTVSFALPAKGIPVEKWDSVAGRKFIRDIKKGRIITWADVDLNEDK